MELKDIAAQIAKFGLPLLGAALPIPGGAALGSALAKAIGAPDDTPAHILATLNASPEAVQKAREFELTHQATILRLTTEAEIAASKAVTDRWTADMNSDSWLSKNIRPMVLCFLLGIYSLFAMLSAFDIKIEQSYVVLLGNWGMLVMSAYFIGRTAEKAIQTYQGGKE